MSINATSAAWKARITPTCKLVLLALADRANGDGECFPTVRDIVERTCLSERAVHNCIDLLTKGGYLTREFRTGRATLYRVHPEPVGGASGAGVHVVQGCTSCTPGVHVVQGGGARGAPIIVTQSPLNPSVSESAPLAAAPPPEPRGSRLPDDWQPTEPAYDGATTTTLARFRDYWIAQPGAKGRKADWQATWRNWCRRDAERAPVSRAVVRTSQLSPEDQNADLVRRMRSAMGQGDEQPLLRMIR